MKVKRSALLMLAVACMSCCSPAIGAELTAPIAPAFTDSTSDLPDMRQRHIIRVLVNYCKTNFFFKGGKPCGYEYDLLRQYEDFINEGIGKKEKKTELIFIPMPSERLLPALLEGKGDIVAAGLKITPARAELVSFTRPYLPNVDEILVMNKDAEGPRDIEGLSGRKVYVRRGSGYAEHVRNINKTFVTKGLTPVELIEADKNLETPDILELVNAGVFELAVADRHVAELWSNVFPNLALRYDIKINTGGKIAWAVRKENPELLASLNSFNRRIKQGSLIGNILFKRHFEDAQCIRNPLQPQERRKLDKVMMLFKKYGEQYGIDWVAIAAQAYQESGLDNSKKSPNGAIGIMQVLPSTAADKNIDIRNIEELESNIHAGVKYLAFLRDNYFGDPEIDRADQVNFALAAYNAGPAGVQRIRNRAKELQLDANRWFLNTEQAALQMNYQETVTYVSHIHKYYVAYRLAAESLEEKSTKLQLIEE